MPQITCTEHAGTTGNVEANVAGSTMETTVPNGVPAAAGSAPDCVNTPLDFMAVKAALAKGAAISSDAAADVMTPLKSLTVGASASGQKTRALMISPLRPIPVSTSLPVDTSPIAMTPARGDDLDPIWAAVVPQTRTRANDIHLPMSLAYAERLCDAYPVANALLVRVSILLHDTGWGRIDESRILREAFAGDDWRQAAIRCEHERQGCEIVREVLPPLGYDDAFVEDVVAIIDGHDTRKDAKSLEDALVRDADRLWRFDQAGIAIASGWFGLDPATYCDRLEAEIIPELNTEAGITMAAVALNRSRALLKTDVLR
jgi:hypothetical protein